VIYAIGHGNRPAGEFMALLKAAGIECVVDVRAYPASRRHPHFAREALAKSLAAAGVHYAGREPRSAAGAGPTGIPAHGAEKPGLPRLRRSHRERGRHAAARVERAGAAGGDGLVYDAGEQLGLKL